MLRDHRRVRAAAKTVEHLFVYGTLKPGHENAHLLEAIGGTWRRGSVVGVMRPSGWAAGMGYPVLTLEPGSAAVPGWVFSSERLANCWSMLDDFEGDDYERVMTTARLDGGDAVSACVYVARSRIRTAS